MLRSLSTALKQRGSWRRLLLDGAVLAALLATSSWLNR
jgi:hypothetical protein